MNIKRILFSVLALSIFNSTTAQVANFSAQEAATIVYSQGWDSADAFNQWTYNSQNGSTTWKLVEHPYFDASFETSFQTIETESLYSLAIDYSYSEKDESAISPEIEIPANGVVEYYVCVYAVWYCYADLKFFVIDGEEQEQLSSVFNWAQNEGFTGPNWVKYSFDLGKYAGKKVKFAFNYSGIGGENVFIDGFKIRRYSMEQDAIVNTTVGQTVHFVDWSEGDIDEWHWEFEGGTPQTSDVKNPEVCYNVPGEYSVKLSITANGSTVATTRQGFVVVKDKAPIALIGEPTEGYLSPFVLRYLPSSVPVKFHDESTGTPTAWHWEFDGATPSVSNEANPTVEYKNEGVYGVSLQVSNSVGASSDELRNAIQVGGSQYVWNIRPEEINLLGTISFGSYGYYAGSNRLLLDAFAEKFEAPLKKVEIDSVQIYFSIAQASGEIEVSICDVAEDGTPGSALATSKVDGNKLQYDANAIVATDFVFAKPVVTDKAFFVVIKGLNEAPTSDDVAILCVRRDYGQRSTTYHYLGDEQKWYENVDDPVSMAVTPHLKYVNDNPTIVADVEDSKSVQNVIYYNIAGQRVQKQHKGIVLKQTIYTDGSSKTTKTLVE